MIDGLELSMDEYTQGAVLLACLFEAYVFEHEIQTEDNTPPLKYMCVDHLFMSAFEDATLALRQLGILRPIMVCGVQDVGADYSPYSEYTCNRAAFRSVVEAGQQNSPKSQALLTAIVGLLDHGNSAQQDIDAALALMERLGLCVQNGDGGWDWTESAKPFEAWRY